MQRIASRLKGLLTVTFVLVLIGCESDEDKKQKRAQIEAQTAALNNLASATNNQGTALTQIAQANSTNAAALEKLTKIVTAPVATQPVVPAASQPTTAPAAAAPAAHATTPVTPATQPSASTPTVNLDDYFKGYDRLLVSAGSHDRGRIYTRKGPLGSVTKFYTRRGDTWQRRIVTRPQDPAAVTLKGVITQEVSVDGRQLWKFRPGENVYIPAGDGKTYAVIPIAGQKQSAHNWEYGDIFFTTHEGKTVFIPATDFIMVPENIPELDQLAGETTPSDTKTQPPPQHEKAVTPPTPLQTPDPVQQTAPAVPSPPSAPQREEARLVRAVITRMPGDNERLEFRVTSDVFNHVVPNSVKCNGATINFEVYTSNGKTTTKSLLKRSASEYFGFTRILEADSQEKVKVFINGSPFGYAIKLSDVFKFKLNDGTNVYGILHEDDSWTYVFGNVELRPVKASS